MHPPVPELDPQASAEAVGAEPVAHSNGGRAADEEHSVVIYTDGSCIGNPGPGGYAAVLRLRDEEWTVVGGEPTTTNNQMELMAAIKGIESLKHDWPVIVYTDSEYIQKGMTEWLPAWKARGWRTSSKKKPVKNQDLWRRLDELNARYSIEWRWLRGHEGDPGNERAHRLAEEQARAYAQRAQVSP